MRRLMITASSIAVAAVVLVGGFVVYPAQAKSRSNERIRQALDALVRDSGMKIDDVSVKSVGSDAFTGMTGGPKVKSVALRIGTIHAQDHQSRNTSSGADDPHAAERAAKDLYSELGDIGSFTLVVGAIEADGKTVSLENSSFTIGRGRFRVVANFAKRTVDKLLAEAKVPATITASGRLATVRFKQPPPGAEREYRLSAQPVNGGRAIRYSVNGKSTTEKLDRAEDLRITEIGFSSTGDAYSITLGGGYSYAQVKKLIDDSLRRTPAPTPPTGTMSTDAIPPGGPTG